MKSQIDSEGNKSALQRRTGTGFVGMFRAALNTRDGLLHALKSERAVRHEMTALLVAIPLAFVLTKDATRIALLIGSICAILAVELLNTAIEKVCDHVTPSLHADIKIIKDMGSAAVFFALVCAALLWGVTAAQRCGLL